MWVYIYTCPSMLPHSTMDTRSLVTRTTKLQFLDVQYISAPSKNKETPSKGVAKYINTFRFYLYTLQNIKFLALPL